MIKPMTAMHSLSIRRFSQFLILFHLVLGSLFSAVCGEGAVVGVEPKDYKISWRMKHPGDKGTIFLSKMAALRDTAGFEFTNTPGREENSISRRCRLPESSWQRFYFRLDSVWNRSNLEAACFIFLGYGFSELERIRREIEFSVGFGPGERTPNLFVIVKPYVSPEGIRKISVPIVLNRVCCVESRLDLIGTDSIRLVLFLDGRLLDDVVFSYPYKREFLDVSGGTDYRSWTRWRLSFDAFDQADKRLLSIPAIPESLLITASKEGSVRLSCKEPLSFYAEEKIITEEWRLFEQKDTLFPVFAVQEVEERLFNEKKIPFQPDSGTYKAVVRRLNSFGQWSLWAHSTPVRIEKPLPFSGLFDGLFVSLPDESKAVKTIEVDKWHDLHIRLKSPIPWHDLAYLIVNIHDTASLFGHPGNKGGRFHSRSNFILNLSLWKKEFTLFEKHKEGSFESTLLHPDSNGFYTGALSRNSPWNEKSNEIRLRFRLPNEVNRGVWRLRCFVKGPKEELLAMKETQLEVLNNPEKAGIPGYLRFAGSSVIVAILFVLGLHLKRGRPNEISAEVKQELARIERFIQEHHHEQISVPELLNGLKMSKARYQQVMRAASKDFQSLLNQSRIAQAKNLMQNTEKSITEIGLDVGFFSQATFFRVFKEIEGMSPGQFKKLSRK